MTRRTLSKRAERVHTERMHEKFRASRVAVEDVRNCDVTPIAQRRYAQRLVYMSPDYASPSEAGKGGSGFFIELEQVAATADDSTSADPLFVLPDRPRVLMHGVLRDEERYLDLGSDHAWDVPDLERFARGILEAIAEGRRRGLFR